MDDIKKHRKEIQNNKFLQKIKSEQKDLNDEIKEIKKAVAIEKKSKREAQTGKRKYNMI